MRYKIYAGSGLYIAVSLGDGKYVRTQDGLSMTMDQVNAVLLDIHDHALSNPHPELAGMKVVPCR